MPTPENEKRRLRIARWQETFNSIAPPEFMRGVAFLSFKDSLSWKRQHARGFGNEGWSLKAALRAQPHELLVQRNANSTLRSRPLLASLTFTRSPPWQLSHSSLHNFTTMGRIFLLLSVMCRFQSSNWWRRKTTIDDFGSYAGKKLSHV